MAKATKESITEMQYAKKTVVLPSNGIHHQSGKTSTDLFSEENVKGTIHRADDVEFSINGTSSVANVSSHKNVTVVPNTNVVNISQEAIQRFSTQLEKYEKKVLPDLLNEHGISPAKFITTVINEVKKNPKLLEAFIANPSSMFASILAGAEIGLMPSEMVGEFYLIPRNIKQQNGSYKMTVCPQIGYKGLVAILLRGGDILRIHTEVVYKGDKFEAVYGLEPNIIHIPDFNAPRIAANIIYAYAVAKIKNGEYQFAVMTRAEIEAVRNMSPFANDLYFNDKKGNNRWMERKVVLTQLSKLLSKNYHSTKKGISMDALLDGGSYLTLDESNNIKLIEAGNSNFNRSSGKKNIYDTLSRLNMSQDNEQ